jgi:hypothetical protein
VNVRSALRKWINPAAASNCSCVNIDSQLRLAQAGLQTGTPDVEHLYELGKRHQWNASDLAWDRLDFALLPYGLRAAFSELLTQLHYGELAALSTSARLVQTAPTMMDSLFGANQVADEGRHVEWFTRLLKKLDAPMPVQPALLQFIDSVSAAQDEIELLVGMNILIEGLAQTLMRFAGRLLGALEGDVLEPLRTTGQWLVTGLAADESRHLAYGIRRVKSVVVGLDAKRRLALEEQVEGWTAQLMALTAERCAGVSALGIDGDALMERCLAETSSRLVLAGVRHAA